jgi:putative phosphoribosyl transferase
MAILFRDRVQAASMLSRGIRSFVLKHSLKNIVSKDNNDVIIMAIPRGGIVTADIVAINLERTLDILISAKIRLLLILNSRSVR